MKKAVLVFGLVLSTAVIGTAQRRTVTNFELDKFKEQRLAAERDYRENYARMGFPSPEELDKQREADMTAKIELSNQLRQSRLEKERLELERRNLEMEATARYNEMREAAEYYGGYSGYVGGNGGYYGGSYYDGRYGQRRRGHFTNGGYLGIGGYRATPVGVYPNPTPHVWRFFSSGPRRGGGGSGGGGGGRSTGRTGWR